MTSRKPTINYHDTEDNSIKTIKITVDGSARCSLKSCSKLSYNDTEPDIRMAPELDRVCFQRGIEHLLRRDTQSEQKETQKHYRDTFMQREVVTCRNCKNPVSLIRRAKPPRVVEFFHDPACTPNVQISLSDGSCAEFLLPLKSTGS